MGRKGKTAGIGYETICLDAEVCLAPRPPGTGHQNGCDGSVFVPKLGMFQAGHCGRVSQMSLGCGAALGIAMDLAASLASSQEMLEEPQSLTPKNVSRPGTMAPGLRHAGLRGNPAGLLCFSQKLLWAQPWGWKSLEVGPRF